MRAVLVLVLVSCLLAQVTCAPARVHVSRVPLTRSELRDMETLARDPSTHAALTASDLHPLTPILLAELDETIPAFVVTRERLMTLAELEEQALAEERERDADREHTRALEMETEEEEDEDETAESDEDDSALIESDFEISAPYGGYGGFGYGGGYGGGKKGGIGYKKVPYKKVPYKKVPIKGKKAPPKKKLPPKKAPPKKKGGFGFGFGGYGGFKKGGFGGY